MRCQHEETCVKCLTEKLVRLQAKHDLLLGVLEQEVLHRQELNAQLERFRAPQKFAAVPERSQAATPPERPARRTHHYTLRLKDMSKEPLSHKEELRDQLVKDSVLEDLAERAENLDPQSPRNSAPRMPTGGPSSVRTVPVEEDEPALPKPTVSYKNPWKTAMDHVDAAQLVTDIISGDAGIQVGREIVSAMRANLRKQKRKSRGSKQPQPAPRKHQRGTSKASKQARGTVKEVDRF